MTAAQKLKEVTKVIKQYKKDTLHCVKRNIETFDVEGLVCAIYYDVMKIVKAKE